MSSRECDFKEAKGKKQFMGQSTLLSKRRLCKKTVVQDDRARSCDYEDDSADYYCEKDFRVGEMINVYGRSMLICDCDPFTQKWYLENFGIDQKAAAIDISEKPIPRPTLPIPPHPGFGREEDTIESWKSLIPKRPKTDMKKLAIFLSGASRTYMARLVTDDPINSERLFRITVYLDDGDFSVYEPRIRNSGVLGGAFMKKQKLRREDNNEYWKPADFEVGRTVVIKSHPLYIFEEEKQPQTPVADVDVIIHKLKKKILDASASLRKVSVFFHARLSRHTTTTHETPF